MFFPEIRPPEQQERMVGNILAEMKEAEIVIVKGRIWYVK
jgi:hypothetical protein